jgi:hypothetical protein
MIFVENTQPHLIGMGNLTVRQGEAPRSVMLRPGMNRLEVEVWGALKVNPLIEAKIEHGHLKVALEGEAAARVASNESLTELHHKQAVKMIESTFERATLLAWRNSESRPVVIKAIESQLKALEASPKSEETEEQNEFL